MGKVLLALIIVPFVLFGAGELLTGGGGAAAVLEINGEEIDAQRLAQEVVILRNETASRMGDNVDFEQLSDERLTPIALQRLTQSTLIRQAFSRLSLTTPDAMLQQSIMQTPDFHVDGSFSNAQMTRVLADSGFNLSLLKNRLAEDMRAAQLRAGITQSGFATQQNSELMLNIISEMRTIDWVELDAKRVKDQVTVTDTELSDYYAENGQEFLTELQVDAEYILIDQSALQEPVDDALISLEYNSQREQFEELERRALAHILLEINDQQSEQQARQIAQKITERFSAGTSFGELAREFSQDIGTSSDGGALGYAEQDGAFPEAFETAAFGLSENEVSAPVLTDAGLHLITVTDIEKSVMPEFAELKPVIKAQIQQRAATKKYVRMMEQAADIAFNAADLQEPASALGLEIHKAAGIARKGLVNSEVNSEVTSELERQIFADTRLLAALFSDEVLNDHTNSELIELNDRQGVVARVSRAHEPRQLAFEEVRARIESKLLQVKTAAKLRELATSLQEQVRGGQEFTSAIQAAGFEPVAGVEVTRQTRDLPRELLDAVFSAPRSNVGKIADTVALGNGRQVLFQIKEIGAAENSFDEQQLALFYQQASGATAQQELTGYIESLAQAAEIKQY